MENMAAVGTGTPLAPLIAITIQLQGGVTDGNVQKAIDLFYRLGFPVKKCRNSSESQVVFTPIEGFPIEDSTPLFEAIVRQFDDPTPLINGYQYVGGECAQDQINGPLAKTADKVGLASHFSCDMFL